MTCKECGKEHWLMQVEPDGTHLCPACYMTHPHIGYALLDNGVKLPMTFQVVPLEDVNLVSPFHGKPSDAPIDGEE